MGKTKIKPYILAFTSFILACHKSGDGGGTGSLAFSNQPQGSYSVNKELPADDMSRYAIGCATAGQPTPAPQIDPRLQLGMVFSSAFKVVNDSASLVSATIENSITLVSPATLSENFLLVSVSGVPNIQAGVTANKSCTLKADGTFACVYTPELPPYQLSMGNCTIEMTSFDPEKKYLGIFTLFSGRALSAFKTVDHITGNIKCDGTDAGPGEINSISIVSNDVPSEGSPSFCGGVSVFTSYELKKADGTLLTGVTSEQTSIR